MHDGKESIQEITLVIPDDDSDSADTEDGEPIEGATEETTEAPETTEE